MASASGASACYSWGMGWFLRRPLTCLFWIAILCAGVAGVRKDPQADWLGALLFAVLFIIGAWAAVGSMHRLGRGAVLVAAPLALAAVVWWMDGSRSEASDTLAFAMLMAGLTFALTLGLLLFIKGFLQRDRGAAAPRWQISLTEILGWTIVVAIASWSASMANIPDWESVYGLWTTMLTPVPAAVIVAAFLGPRPRCDRIGFVAVSVALAAFFAFAIRWDEQDGGDLVMYAFIFGTVAVWALVVRLDENAAERAVIAKWWPRRHSGDLSENLNEQ